MERLDTHMHFWRANELEYPWMPPADSPEGAALRARALPADAARGLSAGGVAGVVAVQARQTVGETYWLLGLADAAPSVVRGVVGWADLRAPDATALVAAPAAHPALVGLRHVLHDEPDAVAFMAGAAFNAGLDCLAPHGLTFDLLLFAGHLHAAAELARRHPRVRFVLDHAGKPPLDDMAGADAAVWRAGVAALGACPNVACKLSGLLTRVARGAGWAPADLAPALDAAWDAFGPRRLLFGSDYPVARLAGEDDAGSARFVRALAQWVRARAGADAADDAEERLFAGNAKEWYPRLAGAAGAAATTTKATGAA